jgi:lipoyl(octanoyl) transferase
VTRAAYVLQLGVVPYGEALELQRSLADAVSRGTLPDTVLLLEHPPVITLGRRAEPGELHVPEGAAVEISRRIGAASRPTTRPGSSSATRSST